jgi:dTDP-glucose pyrophosphorylase
MRGNTSLTPRLSAAQSASEFELADHKDSAFSLSIAITGGVRSSMMLKVCPENESKRYFAHNKSNGLKKGQTLTFVIQDAPNESSGIGQLVWTGTSELTSEDLVLMGGNTVKKKDEATAFLEEVLSQGPVDKKTVQRKASQRNAFLFAVLTTHDKEGFLTAFRNPHAKAWQRQVPELLPSIA